VLDQFNQKFKFFFLKLRVHISSCITAYPNKVFREKFWGMKDILLENIEMQHNS